MNKFLFGRPKVAIAFVLFASILVLVLWISLNHAPQFLSLLRELAPNSFLAHVGHVHDGDDDNRHTPGTATHGEHDAMFALVPHNEVTAAAVKNGNWSDPTIWDSGAVPGAGEKVLISEDVTVTYDLVSDTKIKWIRVDGVLTFSRNVNTRLVFDTLIVDADGELNVGDTNYPIPASVKAELVVANNGPIDVSWDPTLISRGVVSHGKASMHGAKKTPHLKVSQDPKKGDTSITLKDSPSGWSEGDMLVIAGTEYTGYVWVSNKYVRRPVTDDVVTITSVNGNQVSFTPALTFDHISPRADLKTSVGNYTRNVVVRNENNDIPVSERGHVMLAHNDNVDVRYASFLHLGRTDKKNDPRTVSEFVPISPTSNVKGRYSLHVHRTGVANPTHPAIILGNAVVGSPGWGFVHHDANATFHNNVSYDTDGAGFVAETGNEIGTWSNNLAIYAKGIDREGDPKQLDKPSAFDNARSGVGFHFQGRLVRAVNNIAASVNSGFSYMHRGREDEDGVNLLDGKIKALRSNVTMPEIFANEKVNDDLIPILSFSNNETFAALMGVNVAKNNPNQAHDVRTVMKNFTAWSIVQPVRLEYTSHYTLIDFDLLKGFVTQRKDNGYPEVGVHFGTNNYDVTLVRPRVEGFKQGIHFNKRNTADGGVDSQQQQKIFKQFIAVEPTMINNATDFYEYEPEYDRIISEDDIDTDRTMAIYFNEPLRYDAGVNFFGTKVDSIGSTTIPAAQEIRYVPTGAPLWSMLEATGYGGGYFVGPNDSRWLFNEEYFSDRVTGEISKMVFPVQITNADIISKLGVKNWQYKNAVNAGNINFSNQAPVVSNVSATVMKNSEKVIDLTSNSTDPDGDSVELDGVATAEHGTVYIVDNKKVLYRPDFDYQGQDIFKFWISDKKGGMTPAYATIGVGTSAPNIDEPEPPIYEDPNLPVSDSGNTDAPSSDPSEDPPVPEETGTPDSPLVKEQTFQNRGDLAKNKNHTLSLSASDSELTLARNRTEAQIKAETAYSYPLGLYEFEAKVAPNGTETVTIVLDKIYDTSNWEYRKYTGQGYIDISDLVTYSTANNKTVITYQIKDNGPLDLDDRLGYIKDPAGPAILETPEPVATSTPSGNSGNGSNGNSGGGNSGRGSGSSSNSGGGSRSSSSNSSSSDNDGSTISPVATTIPSTFSFERNISYAQSQFNDYEDVRMLETFLNQFENENLTVDGVYSDEDNEAIKRFQKKYQREILDVWDLSDATGYVGITTRLKMNFLLKGQTAQCPAFTEYNGGLSGVMNSPEIGKTQELLKKLGMYNGPINNTWDSDTNKALIRFQETFREVMLDPWDIKEGTGYKYKTTNKFLNYFAGCDTGSVFLEGVGEYEGI